MKFIKFAGAFAALLFSASFALKAADKHEPTATYLYDVKDGEELYLDIYEPAHKTTKPTVIFVFGGGFSAGSRSGGSAPEWFKMLGEAGYRVVSIDYRLGLKNFQGAGINPKFIKQLKYSIDLAVEDLFSATNFLINNAEELGIDPSALVVSGSSAGAITAMQAEWEICNAKQHAAVLPEGFNYAGVMSFSGAIFTTDWKVKYKNEPCPTLMMHGTADKIVPYTKIKILNLCFAGTDTIADEFASKGYSYNIYRFLDHGHEIATHMVGGFDMEMEFLETCVEKKIRRNTDSLIDDPQIPFPSWAKGNFTTIY